MAQPLRYASIQLPATRQPIESQRYELTPTSALTSDVCIATVHRAGSIAKTKQQAAYGAIKPGQRNCQQQNMDQNKKPHTRCVHGFVFRLKTLSNERDRVPKIDHRHVIETVEF